MEFIKLIDSYEEDIVKSTQDIVAIKSVEEDAKPNMPFGEGPYKALQFALNLAEEMGFDTKNLDNYAAHADLGDGQEVVGVLVHLDVVPEGDGWTYPPYGGEIHDGKIYGRGTADDKGPAIACMYAMKALKESKVPLSKKIRIIFGTNEETGWGCMKHYFAHEKAPDMAFTPDAEFPAIYGEKGIIVFDLVKKLDSNNCGDIVVKGLKGGNAPNMVPDYCEAVLEVKEPSVIEEKLDDFIERTKYPLSMVKDKNRVKIIAKGVSAHGSTPEKGENAISYLMSFLGEILDGECDVCEFVNMYNGKIAFKHHGEGIGCGLEDDVSGKLNFNPGMIRLSNEEIKLTINVRYPIKSSSEEVYSGIRNNLKGTGIQLIEGKEDTKPLYVPKDNFLVKKLMDVYREQTGDKDSEPIAIGGGTYARAMENAVAFGPVFPGQKEVAHQKDEFISIEHLMKITRIYAHALYELAK
ncbi:dipeptidase PepV [Clostridium sp. Cult3]|uniref:dipeptidase PepV n=1 Tax=Clostridium sp. Cult3 TaxID=2079004 RepID=UPI001F0268E9|nr:dipeptidase PepV [Clostridium sp. Cult3]MCF6461633.1 dipeptidase PepV [Clostridium sp. Cult3]